MALSRPADNEARKHSGPKRTDALEQRPAHIQTEHLERCIRALDQAREWVLEAKPGDTAYAVGRAACVKEFEVALELSGKLLKRCLRPFFASDHQADRLSFKDVFRHAAKHGLISADACERWLEYRDARNVVAHDYGQVFATDTLQLLPEFISDARALAEAVRGAP